MIGAFISYRWPGQWLDRLLGNPKERAPAIEAMRAAPVPPGERPPGAQPKLAEAEPVYANLDGILGRGAVQDPSGARSR